MIRKASRLSTKIATIKKAFKNWKDRLMQRLAFSNVMRSMLPQESFISRMASAFRAETKKKSRSNSSFRFDPRKSRLGARFEALEGRSLMAVLGPGDLALVGYDTSGSPTDNFSIVALRELDAGTTFFVNDNEISAAGGSTFTDLNEAEAQFTVKAGQTIPAGTVINLPWGAAAVSTSTYDWTSTSGAGLGAGNDELYFYNAASISSTTATSFITFGQLGSSIGNVPAGLTLGTNAVDTTGSASRYKTAGATYSGSPADLSTAINNAIANWESIATGQTNTISPGNWTFSVSSTAATTTTALTSVSPLTIDQGQAVTFGGTIVAGSGSATPVGTVEIRSGSTVLASTTTIGGAGVNGTFSFSSTTVPVGTYSNLQAFFVAGSGFQSSNSSVFGSTLTVNAVGATTTTGLDSISPLAANAGDSITFAGRVVAGSGSATPVGTIEIRNGGASGTLLASTTTIGGSGVNGTFSISSTTVPVGNYSSIQAFFIPGSGFQSSSSGVFGSSLSVASTIAAGDIAIIGYNTAGSPNDGFTIVALKTLPGGTTFYVNDNEVAAADGTSFTDLNEGEAVFTVKPGQSIPAGTVINLPWGAAAVDQTAYSYSDTTGFGLSNPNEELYIYTANAITDTTPTAFIYGAAVSAATGQRPSGLTAGSTWITPTGTASRYKTSGATYAGDKATLLAAIGDTTNNWEAVAPVNPGDWTFTVGNIASTTTALTTVSPLTANQGDSITFSGTVVAGSGTATPTGTIQIRNGGIGGTLLASTTTIGGSGVNGTFSISSSAVPPGTYSNIQAFFVPSGTFSSSSSTVFGSTLTINAVGATTTTGLNSISPLTANTGDNVTFAGTVVAGSGSATPVGTIEIRNGGASGTLLASTTTIGGSGLNGTFSISSTTVPAGTYNSIQAFFIPGSGFQASNSAVFGSTLSVSLLNFVGYSVAGSTYSQNFDALINTGTATPVGNGPHHLVAPTYASSTVTGWHFSKYAGSGSNAVFTVSDGALGTGSVYSYGTTGQADRALGSVSSGTTISRFGAIIRNTTGSTLGSFTITYDGEQWRNGVGSSQAANTLSFEYAAGVAAGASIDSATFTPDTGLDFVAPVADATEAAVDGNVAGKVAGITKTISGLSWAPGTDLIIRWNDVNDTGNDDGLAIDNFQFSATAANVNGTLSFSSPTYIVTENGTSATVTVNRVGPTQGAISVGYGTVAGGTAVAGTDYTTTNGTLSWADGDSTPKTFSIPIIDNVTLNANKTINIALSNPTGGAELAGTTTGTVTIRENEQAPQVLLNEIVVNPPTGNDRPFEFIEIRGTASTTLGSYYVAQIDGGAPNAANTGVATFLADLSSVTLGSNGLLVVKAANGGHTINAPTTVLGSTLLDVANGVGLSNNAHTIAVIFSPTPIALNQDLDTNDDGTLDLPAGAVLVDAIGWKDNSGSNAGFYAGRVYGGVEILNAGTAATSGTPDAATRFVSNSTPLAAAAWFGGDLADSGTNSETAYDPTKGTANLPAGAVTSPGSANEGFVISNVAAQAEGNSGFTAYTFTINRLGDLSVAANVTWTVTGSGTNAATAQDFENGSFPTGVANFAINDSSKTITINVVGDTVIEFDEGFTVTLSNPTNGSTIADGIATSTITNDDFQTLVPGDVVITGINTTNPDQFAFVALVPLAGNSQLTFTDNAFDGSALLATEGNLVYTVPAAGLPAGTKVVIQAEGATSSVLSGGGTVVSTSGFQFNTTGDNLFVYNGQTSSPTYLFGLSTNSSYTWDSGNSAATTSLPPGLVAGTSAVAPLATTGSVANAQYTGPTTGNAAFLLASVANQANWTTSATALTLSPDNFTIGSTNAAPVVTASGGSSSFTGTAIAIDTGITVTDSDSANLTGATVSISTAFAASEDVLGFVNANGITGSYNSGTGVLTLSGSATVANYQTALRSVTYNNTNASPNTTNRVVSFQVNDGGSANNLSNVATKTVTVANTSNLPVSVTSVTPTTTGFRVQFSRPVDPAQVNLYDATTNPLGVTDVTLTGATTGAIRGSAVFNATNTALTFVKTGPTIPSGATGAASGTLDPDTYTLTLRSAATGFVDLAGNLLRDNGGSNAGNYVSTFTVSAPASNAVTLSIPDFARGFSQAVNVPNTSTGLPVIISNANGIGGVDLTINYDPALLTITGVTTPIAGASAIINTSTPGTAVIQVSSATAFATVNGAATILNLIASVPATAPYAAKGVISFTSMLVRDTNLAVVPSVADNAVHVAGFFGDMNADQNYDSADSILVQRLGVGTNSGTTSFQTLDPYIIGDSLNDYAFDSADSITVQRLGVGATVPAVPALPPGAGTQVVFGVDPELSIGHVTAANANANTNIFVPINLLVTEAGGITLAGMDFAISFDPSRFQVNAGGVTIASSTQNGLIWETDGEGNSNPNLAGGGFSLAPPNIDNVNGTIRLQASSPDGTVLLPFGTSGTLLRVRFTIKAGGAAAGQSAINLMQNVSTTSTRLRDNNLNALLLVPAPTNGADTVDGSITIPGIANSAPTALSLTPATLAENAGANATIGTFTTTDPNAGNTHTYTLVSGAGDADNAAFNISGNSLRANASFDFETKNSYTVRVRTTDQGGLFFEKQFTITVTNVNETPTDFVLSASSIAENAVANATVGTFSTTDPDALNTHTYSLVSGTGSTDNAAFTITGNTLTANAGFDFETKSSYSIRVRTTDQSGLTFEKSFVITVTNVNEAPTLAPQTFSLPENSANGTVVGTVVANDVDAGDTRSFAITGGNTSGAFAINASTGEITVANTTALDFETTPSFPLTVSVTDAGGLAASNTVTINLTDVSEDPIYINEIYFNPGGTDSGAGFGNEFIELRGTPGATIAAGTYLVGIEGDSSSDAGDVQNIFPLSGLTFGTNGILLLLQKDSGYNTTAAAAAGATIVRNTGTGSGWGNGATSSIGHLADSGNDIENASATFMLIRTSVAPTLADDIDTVGGTDGDGTIDGVGLSWEIVDSIGILDTTATDFAYGRINFAEQSNGTSTTGPIVAIGGEVEYVGRIGNSTGSTAADWIGVDTTGVSGTASVAPAYIFQTNGRLSNNIYAGSPINTQGLPNNFTLVAPTDIALSATTVDESIAAGTTVGTFTTTDPTAGDTHTYTLVSGTGSTDNAAFTIVGNALNIIASPNFEVKSSYAIRVRTTDATGVPFEKEFTINVNNLNEAPVFGAASYTFTVPENSVAGTVVGSATASDPDAGAVLVYSLSGTGASNFAISSTGEITVAAGASLDFETTPSYSLTVTVSDGTLSATAPATINLTNVNESPVFGAASYSFTIAENAAAATSVGSVSATDPDAATTLVYSLSGRGSSNFAIDSSGAITVATGATLNFETTPSFSLTVEVSDGTLTTTAPLTIALTNVNEAPLFTPDSASFTVAENAANGVVVGTVTAVDPDAGDTLTYLITGGNGTGTGAFAINATTGQITVADSAQMAPQTYTLTVNATDALGLVDTITVSILVSANIAPSFAQASYTFSLAENAAAASPVGQVTATDPEFATLTYSLSGTGSSNFVIDSGTGAITVAAGATLDFEGTNSFSLMASVSDGFLSSSVPVTINLTNVNEAPVVAAQSFSVAENSANGTVVGTVVASDVDAGTTLSYMLSGTGAAAFAIGATGEITVANSSLLNFETTPVFNLSVAVSDGSLSTSAAVTINLTNVNEAPVVAAQSFSVAENSANGTVVGTVVASDVDAGTALSYTLSGTGAAAFAINATGEITVANSSLLNFETTPVFNLSVAVSDGSLSTSAAVTINLTNVNEAPVIAAQSFSVAENSANGTVVGTVVASDVDAGTTLSYMLSGTGAAAFAISATGEITVANSSLLNFETTPVFNLSVAVSDGSLSTSAAVTINLTNVNEAPVVAAQSFSVAENSANGTVVGTVVASDVDAGTTLSYALSGTGAAAFAISATGEITVANSSLLNFETTPVFNLSLAVSDGSLSTSAAVTINLTNVNEAPVVAAQSFSVAENSANGTVVGTIVASDVDTGTTLSYMLSGTGASAFAISATGQITVANRNMLNFETTPVFNLSVAVSDGSLSTSAAITINLTNVNEAPVFGAASYSFTIAENSAAATVVGSVSATDPDAATTLVYSLSGTGSSNFAINAATGAIVVTNGAVLDFETTPSIVLTATVSDGSLSANVPVTITLTDANDAPTDISISDNRVADNATPGTVIGSLTTTDPDGGTHSYALSGVDASNFVLAGNELQVSPSYSGNQATYSIDIITTDNGGLTFTKTFTIIRVAGANQAPSNIVLTGNSVAENSASGSTVGSLTAIDPNPNNTFTFALVSGAGSTNNAAFSISGSSLNLATVPDFEANSSYSIRVRVTDQGGLSFDRIFTINVTNVNEAPTDINLSNSSVTINAAAGTVVGTLSTVDPDAGSSFTYTLSGADASKFAIVGNSLRVGATALDGVQTSYSLSITSSDGSLSYTESFTIGTIAAPNTAPTNILLSNNLVAENSPIGTPVGTLSAVDANQASGHTFALVSGAGSTNNSIFAISGTSLNLASVPDFEAGSSYNVRVRVTDAGGLTFDRILTINVANVNEAPTDINLSNSSVAINATAGTVVGTLSTVDPDAGSVFSYTLSGTDASKFTVVGSSLRTAVALDGIQTSYNISITSSDGSLTYTEAFTIGTIAAANTAPTNITLTSNSVPENTASGTTVGTLGAQDANQASGHTFALVAGAGSTDNGSFIISGSTLTLNTVPNFEAKSSYSIRVRVTDAGGLTFDKVFSINVTNVNEAPTNVNLSNSTVAINAAAGTAVGNLSTVDPDSGNTHTYVVGGADASRFVVVGNSLRVGPTALNGTTTSYSITVTTTDQGGLTFTRAFTIGTASAPNTAPTNITLSSTNVQQNSAAGTVIGTLGAVDANQTTGFTFALVSGAGSTNNATFDIVNGQLVLRNSIPSRATMASYVVRIRVTDAGGLSFDKIFGINVTL